MISTVVISFIALVFLGIPIVLAVGIPTILPYLMNPKFAGNIVYVMRSLVSGLDSTPILSIPLFMLSGAIMARGGISKKLFNVFAVFIGKRTAGMPIAVIVTCLFYGAISGSGPATTAAVGTMCIPILIELGYDKKFSAALVASAGGLGVIIPPSIPFINYGVVTGESIGALFTAGIIPGCLVAFSLMVYAYIYCKKNGEDKEKVSANHEKLLKKGNITVDIYPNGNLGNVMEAMEGIKDGTIQMQNGTPGSGMTPTLGILDLPNVVTSRENARELLGEGTPLRQAVEAEFDKMGLKLLAMTPQGFRVMSSNKAVRSYGDIAGTDIRVMENPVSISYWKAWGANPTPIAFAELYTALQQGLVDAQENPLDVIISAKLYEQQKYIINTNHIMFYNGIWMNGSFYESLSQEYKDMIGEVAKEVDEYVYNDGIETEEKSKAKLEELGVEFIELPESDLIKMRETATETVEIVRESAGDELVDLLLNEVNK